MEKTLALVIRTVDFSESSTIATLYTEDFGKITALAKGARRRKSPFESALDLLALSRIVFIPKRSDVLDLLTEARLERRFRSASRDLGRFYAALYVAELLDAFTDRGDPSRELFAAACSTIQQLDLDGDVAAWLVWFELRMLWAIGHLPELQGCVDCGRPMDPSRPVTFSHSAGGVVCERCKHGKRQLVRITAGSFRRLVGLAQRPDGPEPDDQPARGEVGELRGLMNHYLANLLGRRLRMSGWIQR